MEATKTLGEFVVDIRYPILPKDVVTFAKELILKTVAGMVAGSACPATKKLTAIVKDRRLPEEVGVIGCGFKTSLWEAVLLHAFSAHNSELEDVTPGYGGIAWDISVIPLLLPLAAKLRLSGRALIEATVAGLEVHVRTSLPFSAEHIGIQLPPTSAMGAAAGAAKALGLNAEQTTSALGFAMSSSSITAANLGTDAHFLESSLHALQGIIGAEMAKEGLVGNPDLRPFEGMLGKGMAFEKITEDLNERWLFQDIWIKKYPVCFLIHRQLDALFELIEEHKLTYDQADTIEVHIAPSDQHCDRPYPKTEGDIQFSFQHVLGAALLDGEVTPDNINADAAVDPRFTEARSKVKLTVHPEFSAKIMMHEPTKVVVRLKDGRVFSKERLVSTGSPQEPLSVGKFNELYRKCTRRVLPERHIQRSMDLIWNLEDLSDLEELFSILTFRYV